VDLLEEGKVVGWFQGRMEFGPRALGSRSILGDPRNPDMQRTLNLKIKFRESFRPFAPSVLEERCADYFDLPVPSPYMLMVAPVRSEQRIGTGPESDALSGLERLRVRRSAIPAVTHVDYSARIQTVDSGRNPRYRRLLEAFNARTGCPVLINTSFNIRGEPIVRTPQEAYRCFMFTEMDVLVLEDFILLKEEQPSMAGADEYRAGFRLD
jgi:carbamoyltransferase